MKMPSCGALRESFVDNLPGMGALVAGIGSIAFKIERNAVLVAKPLLAAPDKPKKRKSPPAKETKAQKLAKTRFATERSTKGWYANGEWVKAWKPNMWIGVSPQEQYVCCNRREQGGNWPEQIPPELCCKPGKKLRLLTKTFQQLCFFFLELELETVSNFRPRADR